MSVVGDALRRRQIARECARVVAKARARKPRKSDGTVYVCKCECGGNVRGVFTFGRLWSSCDSCTPTVTVNVPAADQSSEQPKPGKPE